MNAVQFIKDHGIEKARGVVAAYHGTPSYTFKEKTGRGYSACQSVELSDLKRLVESVDLIDSLGGLELSKKESNNCRFYEYADMSHRSYAIKQAIADYESIYGGEHV